MVRIFAVLTLLTLVAACDSNGSPPEPTLSGEYVFTTPPDDSTTGRVTLASDDGTLTGSGTVQFRHADGTVAVEFPISHLDGSHRHPNVSMQWQIDGQGPYAEVGSWSVEATANDAGDRISGTLTRDEGDTAQITFTTQ